MPSSVWGYEIGDWVEWRPVRAEPWRLGKVVRFNTNRLPIVSDGFTLGGSYVVGSPDNIRRYEPPSTPDDIESFLAQ